MKFHEMGQTDLLEATNTSMKQGLTEKEVKKRLDKHGPNEMQEGKNISASLVFRAVQRFYGACAFGGNVNLRISW